MTTLTADDVAGKHEYLASARPDWSGDMRAIRARGGPWQCPTCSTASLLVYRCSACGRDLSGGTDTAHD